MSKSPVVIPQKSKNLLIKTLKLAIGFIVVLTVYLTILRCASMTAYMAFYIIAVLLFCVTFVLDGATLPKNINTASLRDDWSAEKKEKFISTLKKTRRVAENLKYLLAPTVIVIIVDLLTIYFDINIVEILENLNL